MAFTLTVERLSNDLSSGPEEPSQASDLRQWSGWRDSNPRPPAPKAGALTKLRYIPWGHRSLPRAGPERAAGRYATQGRPGRRAGVAQWQSSSLPSWSCGFDSRRPLHRVMAGQAPCGGSIRRSGRTAGKGMGHKRVFGAANEPPSETSSHVYRHLAQGWD